MADSLSTFSPADRSRHLSRMANETFDLLVIGGGITGAGTARDAVSRGMKVALVEARDFAEGTSSRSSKLIHGGIRYLENLEFGLVFEALSERRVLFEIAPHLVHPLRFVLPLYKGGRVGMFKMGLGMWLYDALSMFEAPELHERLNAAESLERLPLLQGHGLQGSYVYSDAYMDDDRLVIETLRSAVKQGAVAASFTSADDARLQTGSSGASISVVQCTDRLTSKSFSIRARHVVCSTGPWTDRVAPHLVKAWRNILRPSKGVHLTFDRKRLQLNQAVVMVSDDEKRIVFGIPRHEMIIIGTTDTDFQGDPATVRTEASDVKYLLHVASEYFPGAKLTEADILASYAGVRPLVDDGSITESKTSREHMILRDPANVTFVAGGKYTTYRLMAQQTVETVLEAFPLEDQVRFGRGNTKCALNPLATIEKMESSRRERAHWANEFGLLVTDVDTLIERHGAETEQILANARAANPQVSQLSSELKYWQAEVHQAITQTMCMNLTDFYFRRSHLFLARADHGVPLVDQISQFFAAELGWSELERANQLGKLTQQMQSELHWRSLAGSLACPSSEASG